MKKTLYIIYVCLSGFILTGCSDLECCDCENGIHQPGNFRLVRDWGGLWAGLEKPEVTDVYFYHPALATIYNKVYSDTSYYELNAGDYHVLAINDAKATYTGMDNYYTAAINLPVTVTDSSVTTVEAPLCLTSSNVMNVKDGKNECVVTFISINKIINFTFTVNSPVRVLSCGATLEGVQTSIMFCMKQPVYAGALLPFSTEKIKENTYYKSLSTFGLTTGSVNLLTIQIECENGITKEVTIDLTGKINFETSPVQNCNIQIDITPDSIYSNVSISDFQPGIDGEIQLK